MHSLSTFLNSSPLRLISLVLALTSFVAPVQATSCITFDKDFNLFAFGFGGKDYQLGTQDSWSTTVTPTDVTTSGRPPFDGSQTTCYLAQFFNAIYVLDGDTSDAAAIYIYDVTAKSWSKQKVNSGGPNPESLVTILDHDTNVFYGMDNGVMWFLNMDQQTASTGSIVSWTQIGNPTWDVTGYKPTMALAENHVHFIGIPNAPDGDAYIFVIHFSFFQPQIQSYPVQGGGNAFPSTHGQTASFFKSEGPQLQFAFIPDDASGTYVIDVTNNSTLPLAGPTNKKASTYAASITALVQLTVDGDVFWLPYTPDNASQSKSASWSQLNVKGLASSSSSSAGSGTTSGVSTSAGSGTSTGGTTGGSSSTGAAPGSSATGASSGGKNGANSVNPGMGLVVFIGSLFLGALVI